MSDLLFSSARTPDSSSRGYSNRTCASVSSADSLAPSTPRIRPEASVTHMGRTVTCDGAR